MSYSHGLIERGASLRRRAIAGIADVNEAYFLVHYVFARAFGRGGSAHDLDRALTCALATRAATERPSWAPS
jgi:hypothetical protein